MEHSGKLKIIDELDPSQNFIEEEALTKFLTEFDHTYMERRIPSRPDYFIIDDFASYLGPDSNDLLAAKSQA